MLTTRNTMLLLGSLVTGLSFPPLMAADFQSDWQQQHDRVWVGPQYWANPMEDWRLNDGRLECSESAPNRSVHLLTHQLADEAGTLEMSVVIGLQPGSEGDGQAGFEIGIQSELEDYRSSLIRGRGVFLGVNTAGELVLHTRPGAGSRGSDSETGPAVVEGLQNTGVRLHLKLTPDGEGYQLELIPEDVETGEPMSKRLTYQVSAADADTMIGNIALVHNPARGGRPRRRGPAQDDGAKFWFSDWQLSGTKLTGNSDQAFGPVLYAMHTLSRGVLNMTAQMPPVGADDSHVVVLQVPQAAAKEILDVPHTESTVVAETDWVPVARANIDPLARTAIFRIPNWLETEDVPYRLVYVMRTRDGDETEHEFTGTVRKDPVDQESVSVAGFTGHKETAFPNELLVSNVTKHDPDVLVFTGDQIYEDAGGYGIIREPAEPATLNYLRKIYLWGWSFRDVLRDRPSLVLPDDHDVYQGNIWGEGGRPVPGGIQDHAQGGFAQPPDFVNAVFRTLCGHHPAFYDPTPMLQGIDVFYGDMVYGRISFAVLEDRYFKSGPEGKVNEWEGRPDHMKDPDYDVSKLDQPGLILLGQRQLEFLDDWAQDWKGADMKVVCSQTIFCNLANYHGQQQEYIYADLDSNGWPQTGRDKAVDAMRRGLALNYAGDQHLASIVHHGIDDYGDANWSFCVPSTAAGYPRSWRPDEEGRPVQNRPERGLPNTGEYLDAFGNFMTVHAVGNPEEENRNPVLELLHDKASGYGLVHFNKKQQTITMECFKLIFDADDVQPEDQFPGWPKTIHMTENDGRQAAAYLPTIEVQGIDNPVIQVVEESNDEVLYTLRVKGTEFQPKVFQAGRYTVKVGDPDVDVWQARQHVESVEQESSNRMVFTFD